MRIGADPYVADPGRAGKQSPGVLIGGCSSGTNTERSFHDGHH